MGSIKVVSYNVNGIRAAIRKGFLEWIDENDFDIISIQETKATSDQIDISDLEKRGYYHYWYSAQKKGYSGVAILTKLKPDNVEYGMGIEEFDNEGRMVQVDIKDTTFISVYFPSGSSGDIRQEVKIRFLNQFYEYIHELRKTKPNLVVSGDYNICNKAIDIHDPVRNKKNSGFLPEERAWMDKFFDSGFIDVFRHFNQEPHHYSWWSYRANARANNKGWRIDYHAATDSLRDRLEEAAILPQVVHSDHCPVYMKLKI